MKKLDKRWLFFLVLILVLAAGLPYLSLYQEASTTKVEESTDGQVMSIALVNEDEGATFNDEKLTFGESFVRGLDNNNDHNWFVVSRGVAESGLNRNTYDMMIVIPNDFSQKALSIDSESPEQVVLNYRINASDDEYVRAEAERTASTILNDFNRRIIDVYFASIIGNLQDAQDNISGIIDKQAQHTSMYNNSINNPLSNYTDQFGMIKDNAQVSRDSFSGLEEILSDFEGRLAEGVDLNKGYLSELDNYSSVKDANTSELLRFNESLLQFNHLLNHPNTEQNFEQLRRTNDWINYQFDVRLENEKNIALQTALLSSRLNDSLEKVTATNNLVENRLAGLETEVEGKISEIFKGIWKEQEEFLVDLFRAQDENVRETIYKEISNLPSMSEEDFEDVGLPNDTVKEIKNVIALAGVFQDEQDTPINSDKEGFLPEYIENLEEHLRESGVIVTDTVWIPANEKDGQEFKLHIPKDYKLTKLELQYPGEVMSDHTKEYLNDNALSLDPNEKGKFSIRVSLKLDENAKIDVFEPVKLGWELKHTYIEKEEIDLPNEGGSDPGNENNPVEPDPGSDDDTDNKEEADSDADNEADSETGDNIESAETVESNDENTENTVAVDPDADTDSEPEAEVTPESEDDTEGEPESEDIPGNEGEPEEDKEPEVIPEDGGDTEPGVKIEKLKIFNNRISHQIIEPVHKMDDATTGLINMVTQTVNPYQKLYSTFDKYLGTEVMQLDTNRLKRIIGRDNFELKRLAADGSLYKFFNDPDINDLITDSMVRKVVKSIYDHINEPLVLLQNRIHDHQTGIDTTKNESEILVERVIATAEQAKVLNDNLGEALEQVNNWREQSIELLETHGIIEQNDGEEQTAIMTLNSDFQSLLTESQSITDQAQGTIHSADTVYETLDTIDSQADDIEDSGVNLVTQADELSTEMTEKLFTDQEFADNFAGVLANSRIGERQNENLYSFLSNPVQTSNEGVITSGNSFTPYFLVLTIFIVVLFTAYAISTLQQKREEADQFAEDKSLMGVNMPITIITAGVGALEGIMIGIISSMLLSISDARMVLWILIITGLMIGMLLAATYLLRQLKMLGMFILMLVMSMYLFLTNAFGGGIAGLGFLRDYSPLQYVERLLTQAVQGEPNYFIALLIIVGLILLGALGNLLVVTKDKKGDLEDEGSKKAS